MVRHWTPNPVIISSIRSNPTAGNFFFAVVKLFEYKIAISANFVQTVKNSNGKFNCIHNFRFVVRSATLCTFCIDAKQEKDHHKRNQITIKMLTYLLTKNDFLNQSTYQQLRMVGFSRFEGMMTKLNQ